MGDDRHVIGGLDHLGGRRHRGVHIAVMAGHRTLAVERREVELFELRAVGRGRGSGVPADRELLQRRLGAVVAVGDDGDGVLEFDHLEDAAAAENGQFVGARQRAAEHRAGLDCGMHHVRHLDIDAVDGGAVDLQRNVDAVHRPRNEGVLLRRLDRRLLIELDLCRFAGQFPVAEAAAGGLVDHLASFRGAFAGRDVPALCRRGDQPFAGAGAGLLDHRAGFPHRAAAAGGERSVDLVLAEIAVGGGVFRLHLGPVAVQFLGHDHRQCGKTALAHFGAAVADDDGVVRLDDDPGVDLAGMRRFVAPRADGERRGFGVTALPRCRARSRRRP